jgi:transposase-like protein
MVKDSILCRITRKCRRVGDCLLFQGHRNKSGYGLLCIDGKPSRAHREMWKAHHGQIDNATPLVRHSCANRNCCSILHLQLGTVSDNAADRTRDGTQPRGERSPRATITESLAQKIKDSLGVGTKAERAARHGVSFSMVAAIDADRSWAHLERSATHARRMAKRIIHSTPRTKYAPTRQDYENAWLRLLRNSAIAMGGCIISRNAPNAFGYTRVKLRGKHKYAHVLSWERVHNDCREKTQPAAQVRHLCVSSPACINPRHLHADLGTAADQATDRRRHGNQAGMTDVKARAIFSERDSKKTVSRVALEFSVSATTVSQIWLRNRYKHVSVGASAQPRGNRGPFTPEDVLRIYAQKTSGKTKTDIARQEKVSFTTVHNIWNKHSHKSILVDFIISP